MVKNNCERIVKHICAEQSENCVYSDFKQSGCKYNINGNCSNKIAINELENLFIDSIKSLITNLFVNNNNYDKGYYLDKNSSFIISDTKDKAKFVLDKIDQLTHLIKETPE
jgi:hypothetical protein